MVKVIVIDDEILEGKMIDFVLTRDCPWAKYAGQACDAVSGLALANKVFPDIVFLDITMPGRDGVSIIRELKESCPDVRIVMLTAHDDFTYIQACMREGANDYLLKPTRPKDVVEAADRWAQHREATEGDPVDDAKRYAELNLEKPLQLSDVAERLYLSPAYFSRLFKQRTGITFSTWLAQRRIQRARRYLEETSFPIAEIAMKVGYPEASSFTRVFRHLVGWSPTEYRKKHQTPTADE